MTSISTFLNEFSKAITEGYAAIFAGAGLSRSCGYTNWKELVKPFAEEVKLDVNKESDLVAITQYYVNKKHSRSSINQTIMTEFTKNVQLNDNILMLTKFPITTYWTTNYDRLLEDGLQRNNRKVDVKIDQESLANNIPDRDAILYKMHGDVMNPAKAVLTKDDYEKYEIDHRLFRTALQGDLINKTFLFIGFSFEDPNLKYILSQIRTLLGENIRTHYCFFEQIKRENFENDNDYTYAKIKQELRIEDLYRYGIHSVELESYSLVTQILHKLESLYLANNVFISGSLSVAMPNWSIQSAENFTYNLAKILVKNQYKIISGFGLGIGSSVINGALFEINNARYKHIDEHLCILPFPQNIKDDIERKNFWTSYRQDMISLCGIAIFIFGNKIINNQPVIASGMLEEFKIAQKLGKVIIPVGSTGGAAAKIFADMQIEADKYHYLTPYWKQLESSDEGVLIETIIKIIDNQKEFCNV
ncbi:SIR2 family protein [Desulfovibrio sp.]|uniref:SIR2 family protein n=1 Tax=Desulfovibrio sp. TaxID=885 RepID=UPI003AB14AB8